jgi:hypothetical protein
MAFMRPQYVRETFIWLEDTHGEVEVYPASVHMPEDVEPGSTVTEVKGIFARLSAPGYLDATDWDGPFETIEEAQEHIRETYEVDSVTGDPLDD